MAIWPSKRASSSRSQSAEANRAALHLFPVGEVRVATLREGATWAPAVRAPEHKAPNGPRLRRLRADLPCARLFTIEGGQRRGRCLLLGSGAKHVRRGCRCGYLQRSSALDRTLHGAHDRRPRCCELSVELRRSHGRPRAEPGPHLSQARMVSGHDGRARRRGAHVPDESAAARVAPLRLGQDVESTRPADRSTSTARVEGEEKESGIGCVRVDDKLSPSPCTDFLTHQASRKERVCGLQPRSKTGRCGPARSSGRDSLSSYTT